MKFYSALASLLFTAQAVFAQTFMINTPMNVVECQPTQFTWTGGQAPFFLTLSQGTTSGGAVIKEFDNLTGTSLTWIADLPSNTQFICNLKDSTGVTVQSAFANIAAGSSTSCQNTAVIESSGGSPGSTTAGSSGSPSSAPGTSAPATTATTPAGASTTPRAPSTTGSPSSPATSSPSKSSVASSASSSPSTTGNSGSRISAGTIVLTGLMGFIGAALF